MPTVEETLTSLGIDFVLHEHPAVFAGEEANERSHFLQKQLQFGAFYTSVFLLGI